MDRGAWRAIVYGVAESDMTEHTQTNGIGLLGSSNVTNISEKYFCLLT